MPEVKITVGGTIFSVACQDGEEHYLEAAARMLNQEAQVLVEQVGRMPEARMLLMAGLMLADKTASIEDNIKQVESKLAERDAELEGLRTMAAPEPERIEVPVIPEDITDVLAEMAARAEAIAADLEEKTA